MDFTQQQREAKSIRADMHKAHAIIMDAKNRYIKAKLKARSKKQTEDAEILFADLAEYETRQHIIEAYGWAIISSTEHERLLNLWDAREQHAKDGTKYRDRVIDMLELAVAHIGDKYEDFLFEADVVARENEKNQQGKFPK